MSSANIVVMGKTGAGKSTLINSVIGEDLVPTGVGGQVTQKNKIYTKGSGLSIYMIPLDWKLIAALHSEHFKKSGGT